MCDIVISFVKDCCEGFLGMVKTRFDGPGWNCQYCGNFLDAQLLKKEQGQRLTVRQGKLVEAGMNGSSVIRSKIRLVIGVVRGGLYRGIEAEVGVAVTQERQRVVMSSSIKEGWKRAGVPKCGQSFEDRDPGFLNQIPSVGLRSHHAPQVIQEWLFEKSDQLVGRTAISPLAAEHKQFAKNQIRVGYHGVPRYDLDSGKDARGARNVQKKECGSGKKGV
jgi:hypothetical protein